MTPARLLRRLVLLDEGEAPALLWSALYFFLLAMLTGSIAERSLLHAALAGVAAALSIQDKCKPREVNIGKLQNILRQQGAYLG